MVQSPIVWLCLMTLMLSTSYLAGVGTQGNGFTTLSLVGVFIGAIGMGLLLGGGLGSIAARNRESKQLGYFVAIGAVLGSVVLSIPSLALSIFCHSLLAPDVPVEVEGLAKGISFTVWGLMALVGTVLGSGFGGVVWRSRYDQ